MSAPHILPAPPKIQPLGKHMKLFLAKHQKVFLPSCKQRQHVEIIPVHKSVDMSSIQHSEKFLEKTNFAQKKAITEILFYNVALRDTQLAHTHHRLELCIANTAGKHRAESQADLELQPVAHFDKQLSPHIPGSCPAALHGVLQNKTKYHTEKPEKKTGLWKKSINSSSITNIKATIQTIQNKKK